MTVHHPTMPSHYFLGVPNHTKRTSGLLSWFTRGRTIAVLAAVLVLVGVSVGFAVAGGGGKHAANRNSGPTTTVVPAVASGRCPLTDAPPEKGGPVPDRPALLVKIGNEPSGDGNARPQAGLNEADVVFDTPAEGFIMRYVAVYQCNDASDVGPIRSVRWVDYHMIARLFVNPILAFAGGINPNVDAVDSTPWISAANLLENAGAVGTRISSRSAPDNLFTSTSGLYGFFKTKKGTPPAIFSYSAALPPGATPAASVAINFSYGTDVIWKWDGSTGMWLHTYSGSPDIDTLTGQQVSTKNIVIEIAHYQIGPYSESTGGSGDIESELLGSGPGYVLRNGTVTKVTWHRGLELSSMTYTNSAGKAVDLAPGRTWVEIDPTTQADAPGGISVTP